MSDITQLPPPQGVGGTPEIGSQDSENPEGVLTKPASDLNPISDPPTPAKNSDSSNDVVKDPTDPKVISVKLTQDSEIPKPVPTLTREEAIQRAWRKGYLKYKLDSNQKSFYVRFKQAEKDAGKRRWYLNWGRRTGKSYFLCVIAAEFAVSHPNCQIKYAAATAKAVRNIVHPLFRKIFADCPADLKPKFNTQEGQYRFPNGAIIHVAGCDDGNADGLRGTESHLNIIDEAGFIQDLHYVIKDILTPMTLTTRGMTILSSTPPRSLAHASVEYAQECEKLGAYDRKTLFDNPRLTPDDIDNFIREDAGVVPVEVYKRSTAFRREYMAEFVADSDFAVIPEWNSSMRSTVVREVDRPALYDPYVSADFGYVRDAHGVVYGYWDFLNARLVIEDCSRLVKTTLTTLAAEIKRKELELWGDLEHSGESAVPVYKRVADSGGLGGLNIAELAYHHQLQFYGTQKDAKELQINRLRIMLNDGSLVIHPRCAELIQQLETTIWNQQRTSYERNKYGHGDLLDALVYLVRNIDRNRNPYPAAPGPSRQNTAFHWRHKKQEDPDLEVLHVMVGRRR